MAARSATTLARWSGDVSTSTTRYQGSVCRHNPRPGYAYLPTQFDRPADRPHQPWQGRSVKIDVQVCRSPRRHSHGNDRVKAGKLDRSEEHTSELQSLMRTSYAVFCLHKKTPHSHSLYPFLL